MNRISLLSIVTLFVLISFTGCVGSSGPSLQDLEEESKSWSKEEQLEAVTNDEMFIRRYDKFYSVPSLKLIKNPDKDVQLAAVNKYPDVIQYIQNPDKDIQLAAVKKGPHSIKFIQNPDKEIQLAAVNGSGYSLEYIQNPDKDMQLAAVKKDYEAIKFIKNPDKDVQLIAFNGWYERIIKVINETAFGPSRQDNFKDINNDMLRYNAYLRELLGPNNVFNHITSPEVHLAAVKREGTLIKYIKNPSKEVQLTALNQDANAINFITSPYTETRLLAYKKANIKLDSLYYESTDKNIMIQATYGTVKITNKSKNFIKVNSIAEYIQNDIFNFSSFTIPPESVKTLYETHINNNITINSLDEKITFGYAIEYQFSNDNKRFNLYLLKDYRVGNVINQNKYYSK